MITQTTPHRKLVATWIEPTLAQRLDQVAREGEGRQPSPAAAGDSLEMSRPQRRPSASLSGVRASRCGRPSGAAEAVQRGGDLATDDRTVTVVPHPDIPPLNPLDYRRMFARVDDHGIDTSARY